MEASDRPQWTWIIATRNRHKVAEIRAILGEQFQYQMLNDFRDAPTVVEDARDFAGNAIKKSVELANWLGFRAESLRDTVWVLADDSGLEVDALGGAPGVHSARFAALDSPGMPPGNSPDAANNAKLLRLLGDVPLERRSARFRCFVAITPVVGADRAASSAVCYANEAELRTQLFDGACEGHIALTPSGAGGFGYDPLFVPRGYTQSFAELGEDVKNRLSHRAEALMKLRQWVMKRNDECSG
jgi:XTP/dITP diphosphohydrolase